MKEGLVIPARLGLALASVALVVLAAELLLRRSNDLDYPPPIVPAPGLGRPIYKWTELGRPGLDGIYKFRPFRTNSAGFRGREVSLTPPHGTFRIALIGDSVTVGGGVDERSTYAMRVEQALNEAAPSTDRRYEVLNFGLPALNLRQLIDARLVPIGLPHSPHMIIYGFTNNDVVGPSYERIAADAVDAPAQRGPTLGDRLAQRSRVAKLLRERWEHFRDLVAPLEGSYVHQLDMNFFGGAAAWRDFELELDRLAELARGADSCVVVLVHTRTHALHALHPFRRHYEWLEAAGEARGFHVVQSLPYFLGQPPRSFWLTRVDMHPNAEGHRLLAEALIDGLRGLPTACWGDQVPAL